MSRFATLILAIALAALPRSPRAQARVCATIDDQANLLDGPTAQAFRRIAGPLCRSGGAALHLVTVPSLEGDSVDAAAARATAASRPPSGDRDVVLFVARAERKAAVVGAMREWGPSGARVEQILDATLRPRLAEGRANAGVIAAATELLLALGADPADVSDPYGQRGVAVKLVLQVLGFFAFLAGAIASVMLNDRRVKRQRALAAAGLGPPPQPEPAAGFGVPLGKLALPPRGHRWRVSIGTGGIIVAMGLVGVAVDRGAGWELATAGAAFLAWITLAVTVVLRTPPVRLHATSAPSGALIARGAPARMSLAIALLPMAILLFCWAAATSEATFAFPIAACVPLLAAYDWGRTREEFLATGDSIERRSPYLRRRKRLLWREMHKVVVMADPRDPYLFVATPKSWASQHTLPVPLALDGIGDIAALLLRQVPPAVWVSAAPGTRELLEALATGAERERRAERAAEERCG